MAKDFEKYGLRDIPRILTAKRPKFSGAKGATWDGVKIILPNGKKIDGFIDTSWGKYVYFQYKGKWRKIDAMAIEHRGNVIKLKKWLKPRR